MLSLVAVSTLVLFSASFSFETPIVLAVMVFFSSSGVTFCYVGARSTWYGMMVWLVYLTALLIMFLFFVSLAPNPDFSISTGGIIWWVSVLGSVVSYSGLVMEEDFWLQVGGTEWEDLSMLELWIGESSLFMAFLGAYLFFVVVVMTKLGFRGGGALRGVNSSKKLDPVV